MATQRVTPPWQYLHEASDTSLESYELSRLNHAANLHKEIAALLEQWIEELAEAMVARWVREDRRKSPPCAKPLDIPSQAELPLTPPRMIDVGPRPVRRLRSKIRTGNRPSA
jgi:hypothetical protein